MIDAAAARDEVRRLRRTLTLHAAWIFPVILAEAAMTFVDGKPGWALFWGCLFAATFSLFLGGIRRDRRRDEIAVAGSDDAVRAFLAGRLDAVAKAKIGPWVFVGCAFLGLGTVNLLRPDAKSSLRAAGDLLLGGYFLGSRLYARFVLGPRFARRRAEIGDVGPDATSLLAERTRAVAAAMGEVQAMVFWREASGVSFRDARAAVRPLLYGPAAIPEIPK